jgi:hypothetical protein
MGIEIGFVKGELGTLRLQPNDLDVPALDNRLG